MQILFIGLGLVLVVFIGIQLFALSSQRNIETYTYSVKHKYKTFEIRTYEDALFTSVKLSTNDYKNSSSQGFSILAGYIFGDNERNEKIAMTSPVAMSLEDSTTMMFMVPKKFDKNTLPKPNQSLIEFKREPAKTVAAIQFKGWANDKRIKEYKQQLQTALDAQGILYTDRFFFLGYNAPYEVFNRKNEVIVELK